MSAVETPPPVEQPAGRRCPRCGAAMTEEQEWCLACGAAVGTRVVAAPGWRAPLLLAALLATVAAIAIALAIIQLADDTDQVAQEPPAAVQASPTPPPAATAVPTQTPDPAATPAPAVTETPTAEPEETATADPGGTGTSGTAEWPADETGWTVMLASERSESSARNRAERFAADGIPGVGVLRSNDFGTLNPGFWVVFAGRYDSQREAADALDRIDANEAYVRRVAPN